MPVSVSIKTKKPKFKGDKERMHIVVKGPPEIFDRKLDGYLSRQGLTPMPPGGPLRIWSSRPSISPPHYIAAALRADWNARLDRATEYDVDRAIGADPGGPDLFSRAPAIDKAALEVRAGKTAFVANCAKDDYARIAFLHGAGWIPVENGPAAAHARFGSLYHTTRDPFIADTLRSFMDEEARARLVKRMRVSATNIALSKSQDAPAGFAVPCPEGKDFKPFQKGGISMALRSPHGAIIGDDMGLGKTMQGIGVLNGKPEVARAIFVCRANMKLKWVEEIEAWKTNPDLSVGYASGNTLPDSDILVINYDIVDRHVNALKARPWDLAILDEAQSCCNPEAQRTRALLGEVDLDPEIGMPGLPISRDGSLVMLTGTPKPSRISQLWPLLTATRPDIWGRGEAARRAFVDRYEPPRLIQREIVRGGKIITKVMAIPGDPTREAELQMRLRGSGGFIRRLKRDTDMPPKIRTPIPLPYELGPEELDLLRQTKEDFEELMNSARAMAARDVTPGESREATEVIDVITGTMRGRVNFDEIARVRRNIGMLKAPSSARFIIDELDTDEDLAPEDRRKTVVFAHHKSVIDILCAEIEAAYPGGVVRYDGSLSSAKKRQAAVDDFQNNIRKRVFVMSLSGATGITLISAYRMRIVEPDPDPSNMVQIEDRIWRMGQEMPCDMGYLFIPDSPDSRIGKTLIKKMETDEKALNKITIERTAPALESPSDREGMSL